MELEVPRGINDEQLSESAPLVRALVVQRLEMIWRACEPRINLSQDDLDLGRSVDPRFLEAGIRVNDRLVALYGLLKPQHNMSEPDPANRVDQRELVSRRVAELEARVRAAQAAGG